MMLFRHIWFTQIKDPISDIGDLEKDIMLADIVAFLRHNHSMTLKPVHAQKSFSTKTWARA